jgi:hypothetical protein
MRSRLDILRDAFVLADQKYIGYSQHFYVKGRHIDDQCFRCVVIKELKDWIQLEEEIEKNKKEI